MDRLNERDRDRESVARARARARVDAQKTILHVFCDTFMDGSNSSNRVSETVRVGTHVKIGFLRTDEKIDAVTPQIVV